jgi:hypothetical protein
VLPNFFGSMKLGKKKPNKSSINLMRFIFLASWIMQRRRGKKTKTMPFIIKFN